MITDVVGNVTLLIRENNPFTVNKDEPYFKT